MTNQQRIDALKVDGAYFAAGALAYVYGRRSAYGCHFGMRSTRDADARAYEAGYNAASRFATQKRGG